MSRGERLYARTPLALPPMTDSLPANRLGLARWLVDRDNPLVARVAVNRLWEQLFGRGLVETSEDFGTQGAAAVAPRAARLAGGRVHRDAAGARRRCCGLIVTSATYRQASAVTPELAERDPVQPAARARPAVPPRSRDGPRRRARRQRAAQPEGGGPSVFPSQPDGIWDMPYNDDRRGSTSDGEDRYRRGLYTFLRRTAPYPMHHDVRRAPAARSARCGASAPTRRCRR